MGIEAHEKFIRKLAYSLTKDAALVQDLIQEGWIALIEAHEKFDASRGLSFITYGGTCARFKMMDFLRKLNVENSRELEYSDTQDTYNIVSNLDLLKRAQEYIKTFPQIDQQAFIECLNPTQSITQNMYYRAARIRKALKVKFKEEITGDKNAKRS